MPTRSRVHQPRCRPAPPAPRRYTKEQAARRRFYNSAAWKRCRAAKLASEPLCERCEARGRTRAATHVHHVLPAETHPRARLDIANLMSLCLPCHNVIEAEVRTGGASDPGSLSR